MRVSVRAWLLGELVQRCNAATRLQALVRARHARPVHGQPQPASCQWNGNQVANEGGGIRVRAPALRADHTALGAHSIRVLPPAAPAAAGGVLATETEVWAEWEAVRAPAASPASAMHPGHGGARAAHVASTRPGAAGGGGGREVRGQRTWWLAARHAAVCLQRVVRGHKGRRCAAFVAQRLRFELEEGVRQRRLAREAQMLHEQMLLLTPVLQGHVRRVFAALQVFALPLLYPPPPPSRCSLISYPHAQAGPRASGRSPSGH